uniref:hypothetical protein n=1 Tax=Ornithobacterium rhinotracheale TaxID=28251 RepID=UPI0039A62D95
MRLDSLYRFIPHIDRCLLHQKDAQTMAKYEKHFRAMVSLGWNVPEFSQLREGEEGYFFARRIDEGFESEASYAARFEPLYREFLNLCYGIN